jgi:pimeloyl-ACP methyl ester carboxylesterase
MVFRSNEAGFFRLAIKLGYDLVSAALMPLSAKRRMKLVLKLLVILVALLLLVGTLYEQIGRWRDRRRFPQVGRSVDIGGRTLNLYCTGQGAPAAILEMSPHTAGYGWMRVQAGIAQFTRACWYDRAGYGWSDPAPLTPRTGTPIANDLHSLLQVAGIPAPYVLVGEAASGLQVRVYASLYPQDVAGMVLVDATHPDQFAYEPEFAKGPAARIPRPVYRLGCALQPVMGQIGLIRLFARYPRLRPGPPPDGMGADEWLRLEMLSYQPTALAAAAGCTLEGNVAQVRAAGGLGDRPLIVLTSPKCPAGKDARTRNFERCRKRSQSLATRFYTKLHFGLMTIYWLMEMRKNSRALLEPS